jgi:hypothetical protein
MYTRHASHKSEHSALQPSRIELNNKNMKPIVVDFTIVSPSGLHAAIFIQAHLRFQTKPSWGWVHACVTFMAP